MRVLARCGAARLPLLLAGAAASCNYEGVSEYRTEYVKSSFDPSKLGGLWYEHKYKDIAQVAASCPTMNVNYNASSGEIKTEFAVYYGTWPFVIDEFYAASPKYGRGVYAKHVKPPFNIPGGNLVQLPTAVVDVTLSADGSFSADGSHYDGMFMYSCYSFGLVDVTELVVATRSPHADSAKLEYLLQRARGAGLSFQDSDLSTVDRSRCKDAWRSNATLVV